MRGPLSGLAGGIAWIGAMLAIFGPAQRILTDPELQSAKFLEVFGGTPPPRMNEAPWIVIAGILAITTLWGWVYVGLSRSWTGAWWRRGLRFGGIAWVLMVPWFEFYLPWNVMREPAILVALEMACWLGVLLCVGVAIAGMERALRRNE
ncbi:MAG TPA: hypothetical protein VFV75_13045 [Candidatus Polarisedimenticolaceae bacterium]|nr:hypothetical protein [Candidatus Polarisedimenticolaceae bacterium]